MDPYAPCPCGSGKKLKFCCQDIVGDMEKVERLQENNQPRMALQILEKVERRHPRNPWVVTHKAMALMDDRRPADAARLLVDFLRQEPNHAFANTLYAVASFNAEGYPAAKKAVHRAFRRSITDQPGLVAVLAMNIAMRQLFNGHSMSAREHMALALRVGEGQARQQAFVSLLEFDGDASIPYPFRGLHQLPECEPASGQEETLRKVRRLAACGCFEEAADLVEELAGQDRRPQLQHMLGLLRAWDGDETVASAALHRAAEGYDDFETAVECETLAQLFDQYAPDNVLRLRTRKYELGSISRLLTVLDDVERIERVIAPEMMEDSPEEPAARYFVLREPLPAGDPSEWPDERPAPVSVARLTIFDASDEEPACLYLAALEGDDLEQAAALIEQAAGDLLKRASANENDETEGEDAVSGLLPRDYLPLQAGFYFPPRTPARIRERVHRDHRRAVFEEIWPEAEQQALGGRSPREAAQDPQARVKLAAAVHRLDVYCGGRKHICPLDEICRRLGLEPPAPLRLAEDEPATSLSLMQMNRLDLSALTTDQLRGVAQRALLVNHPPLTYRVLRYVLDERPDEEIVDRQKACETLCRICREADRTDESLQWVQRGIELAEAEPESFEPVLRWKMHELMLRIDDPQDERFLALLDEMWHHYGVKLPELRQHISKLLELLDVEPPWETAIVTPAGAAVASGGEKKLWLPGDS